MAASSSLMRPIFCFFNLLLNVKFMTLVGRPILLKLGKTVTKSEIDGGLISTCATKLSLTDVYSGCGYVNF